ncbi:MAG TPA: hypothetical protein VK454_09230 [Myxococcaceae bacterium]|nr:hypothetical protein [Myxococcaceae bacterium]
MHRGSGFRGLAVLSILASGAAFAQGTGTTSSTSGSTPAGTQWTVDSAQTVGDGSNVVRGQVGYPGIWLDYIHGLDPTFDIGGRFSFNYGFQGSVQAGSGQIGLLFQVLLRKQFIELAGFKMAATFNPGFMLYFPSPGTVAGITFPIGAQMGFPIMDKLVANASFELPMYLTFAANGAPTYFYFPILFGGGVEYFLQPDLALTFKLALGPTISSGTFFTLETMIGIAYKLH